MVALSNHSDAPSRPVAARADATVVRRRVVAGVYYLGLCLLLGLIISKTLTDIIPGTVGKHIGYDSEGYVLALVLPLWIEFIRPRLAGKRYEWAVTAAAAGVLLAIFVVLWNTHTIIGSVKTLNETFFALVFLVPYVQPTRRPSKYVAAGCAAAVLVLVAIFDHTSLIRFTTPLAEGLVMMILAPVAFDIADLGILRADRHSPLRIRQAWWALLVVVPLVFIALHHAKFSGTLGAFFRYAVRPQEAFVGVFILSMYFALRNSHWLNNPGNPRASARPATTAPTRR